MFYLPLSSGSRKTQLEKQLYAIVRYLMYSSRHSVAWTAHYKVQFCSAEVKEEFSAKPPPMDYTTTFKGDFTKGVVVYISMQYLHVELSNRF